MTDKLKINLFFLFQEHTLDSLNGLIHIYIVTFENNIGKQPFIIKSGIIKSINITKRGK